MIRIKSRFLYGFFLGAFVFSSAFGVESIPSFMKKFPREAAHKLMSGKQVVGKTSIGWSLEKNLLRFDEDSEMKITLFNKLQEIETKSVTWTNSNLEIQQLSFEMKSSGSTIAVEGKRLGAKLQLKVLQGGQSQTKDMPLSEPVLTSSTLRPFLLMRGLPKNQSTLSATMLEPSALTTVPVTMKIKSKTPSTWTVDIDYLQHKMASEISEDGNLLYENSDFAGLPIEARLISSKEMKGLNVEGTKSDLVELAKVQYPPLANSKDLKKLAVKISGIDLHSFVLNRHRQVMKDGILTTYVENLPKEPVPVQSLIGQPNLEVYLQGDTLTEVYDPLIQKTAREIVGKETDLWKRALLVHQFVFKELEKTPTVSIPNAIEVLKTKKGDCNEHAVLYTALARAANIPARTVVGLVYSTSRNGSAGFFYHAWVEVFTGKDWIAIDPTWNQIPADATHIAFIEGGIESQVQVTSLMGKIKLTPAAPSL